MSVPKNMNGENRSKADKKADKQAASA